MAQPLNSNDKPADNPQWRVPYSKTTIEDPLLQCLIILTKFYNQPFSAEALTGGLPLENGLLTPALFIRAAQRANLSAKLLQRPLSEISQLALPAVLLLENKQACILERLDNDGFAHIIQAEAGAGSRKIALDALAKEYAGYAIFTQPAYRFEQRTDEPALRKNKHWFWHTLTESIPIYSEVLIASFLMNVFALASPLFIMNVYDRVVPNNAVATLWVLAIGVAIVFIFDFILRNLRAYFIDMASKNIDARLSAEIFERIIGVKMAVRPSSVGAFANTVHAFEAFRDFITSASISVLIDFPFTIIFIAVIFMLAGTLALIPLILIPIVIGIGYLIQLPLDEMVKQNYRYAAQKQATLIETLTGIETIKSASAESPIQRRWERVTCLAANLGARLRFFSNMSTNFAVFSQQFGSILVIIFGVYKIAAGDITVGALIATTILTGRALAPMVQVAGLLTRYHQSITSLHSVNNLMEMPVDRPQGITPLHREKFLGAIEFRNVQFSYPRQLVPALKNISFKIQPGERVGLIGRIGSGKSTLQKLIIQLYQPDEGNILLDGVELQQLDPTEIRHQMGYISQDVMLFYGSVKENIVFSAPYVEDSAILRAAIISGVDDFVKIHPQGFDLQVGERGTNLSGGQRQAVAIARALLVDPPILLFDEPTSHMDDKSEALFKARLIPFLENKTFILVTQRGSMLSLVDRLIILDGGQLIADGPKQAVLQALKDGKIKTPNSNNDDLKL